MILGDVVGWNGEVGILALEAAVAALTAQGIVSGRGDGKHNGTPGAG